MTTIAQLKVWSRHRNIAAFLRVIREGESGQDDTAYLMRYPNKRFDDLSKHPQIYETTPDGRKSSAAGAYQITFTTWGELVEQYGFSDFRFETQDIAAVALLARRNAIEPLLAGDLDTAIVRCRNEWTSLPGAAENARVSVAKAHFVYEQYGGKYSPTADAEQPDAPIEDRAIVATPADSPRQSQVSESLVSSTQANPPMLPLIIPVLLQALASALPVLGPLFGTGEVAVRNQKLGSAALDVAVKTLGAANEQEAVQKIASDKEAAQAVQAAILAMPEVGVLLEAGGGGIDGARKFAQPNPNDPLPFWKQGATLFSTMMMLLLGYVVWSVLSDPNATENMKTQVVTAVLGFGGIVGAFWLGSSNGSQRKDQLRQP